MPKKISQPPAGGTPQLRGAGKPGRRPRRTAGVASTGAAHRRLDLLADVALGPPGPSSSDSDTPRSEAAIGLRHSPTSPFLPYPSRRAGSASPSDPSRGASASRSVPTLPDPASAATPQLPPDAWAADPPYWTKVDQMHRQHADDPAMQRRTLLLLAASAARQGDTGHLLGLCKTYLAARPADLLPAYLIALSSGHQALAEAVVTQMTEAPLQHPDAALQMQRCLYEMAFNGRAATLLRGLHEVERANWPVPRAELLSLIFAGAIRSGSVDALREVADYVAQHPTSWGTACTGELWERLLHLAVTERQARAYALLAHDRAAICPQSQRAHHNVQVHYRRLLADPPDAATRSLAEQVVGWGSQMVDERAPIRNDAFRQVSNVILHACMNDDVEALNAACRALPDAADRRMPRQHSRQATLTLIKRATQAAVAQGSQRAVAYMLAAPWWPTKELNGEFLRQQARRAAALGHPQELIHLLLGPIATPPPGP